MADLPAPWNVLPLELNVTVLRRLDLTAIAAFARVSTACAHFVKTRDLWLALFLERFHCAPFAKFFPGSYEEMLAEYKLTLAFDRGMRSNHLLVDFDDLDLERVTSGDDTLKLLPPEDEDELEEEVEGEGEVAEAEEEGEGGKDGDQQADSVPQKSFDEIVAEKQKKAKLVNDRRDRNFRCEISDGSNPSALQGELKAFPLPVGDLSVAYFEIEVIANPAEGIMGIGFAMQDYRYAMPGWGKNTYGFHGDDGGIYFESDVGKDEGDDDENEEAEEDLILPWADGEIIGAGIDYLTKQVFFTRNGALIGKKLRFVEWPYHHHPTVSFGTRGAQFIVNFGSAPFAFDLIDYQSERRLQAKLSGTPLPEWKPFSKWVAEMRESRAKDCKVTVEELEEDPRFENFVNDYSTREDDSTEFDRFRRYFGEQMEWLEDPETERIFNPANKKIGKKTRAEAVMRLNNIIDTLEEETDDPLPFNRTQPPHLLREVVSNELAQRLVFVAQNFAMARRDFKHNYKDSRSLDLADLEDDRQGIGFRKLDPVTDEMLTILLVLSELIDDEALPATHPLVVEIGRVLSTFLDEEINAELDAPDEDPRGWYLIVSANGAMSCMSMEDQTKAITQFHERITNLNDFLFTFDKPKTPEEPSKIKFFEKLAEKVPPEVQTIYDHQEDIIEDSDLEKAVGYLLDPAHKTDSPILVPIYIHTLCRYAFMVQGCFAPPWGKISDLKLLRNWSLKAAITLNSNVSNIAHRFVLVDATRVYAALKTGLITAAPRAQDEQLIDIDQFLAILQEVTPEIEDLISYFQTHHQVKPTGPLLPGIVRKIVDFFVLWPEVTPFFQEGMDELDRFNMALTHRWHKSSGLFIRDFAQIELPKDWVDRVDHGERFDLKVQGLPASEAEKYMPSVVPSPSATFSGSTQ